MASQGTNFNRIARQLLNLGTHPGLGIFENNQIRIINSIYLSFGFLGVFFAAVFFNFGFPQLASLVFIHGIVCWAFLPLALSRHQSLVRFIFLLLLMASVFTVASSFGPKYGVEFWFLTLSLLSFLIFQNQIPLAGVLSTIAIGLVLLLRFSSYSLRLVPFTGHEPDFDLGVAALIIGASMLVNLSVVRFLLRSNKEFENREQIQLKKFQSILQNIDERFWEISKDRVITAVWCSDKYKLESPAGNVIGRKIKDCLPEDLAGNLEGALDQAQVRRGTVEVIYTHTKETTVHWRIRVTSAWDDQNRFLGFTLTTCNITEQFNLEKDLETQQLKVIQQAKMLALSEMAGGIAHEINNPLNVILGLAETSLRRIKQSEVNPREVALKLERIVHTVQRISKIVKSLRTITNSSESNLSKLEDVSQIVETTVEICREKFYKKETLLRLDCEKKILSLCRASEISQVLINLISNSLDAVQTQDEKWVHCRCFTSEGNIRIEVEDSGAGIPEEILTKIMQPFFTTKEVGQGTGLGLSVSQGMMRSHHGDLFYDSSFSHTCFVMEFPKQTRGATEKTVAS